MFILPNFNITFTRICSSATTKSPKQLYKYLIRQCRKLPKGPKQHYQFMVKQSFKQHVNESDPERIKEIITRSYEHADWILEKYLVTSSTCATIAAFWESALVYHNRPHLVNRKLIAVSQVLFCKIHFNSASVKDLSEIFTRSAILYEVRKLKELSKENISERFIKSIIECYDSKSELIESSLKDFQEECNGVFVSVRILMPRNLKLEKCLEVVILDKDKNTATFFAVSENNKSYSAPPFPYELELTAASNLRINLSSFEDADTSHAEWIADNLFPKLLKWIENDVDDKQIHSLSLISVDDYCLTYGNLKSKYGNDLIKEWPKKTNTNPQKYVFEDIAIASYLICLWKKYAKDEVKFVDCGCGNGLLVYILNQEGFNGYGIDIRRRRTWDIYPESTKLEVGTVTPSSLFPDCTWLIGNHSDELTPWIPVISLRSSKNTNFFALPCCPYDFSGQKYHRNNTSLSQYSDYLGYIQKVCEMCGFNTEIDKLRIPSTKRTCLVGIRKQVCSEELNRINSEINAFIDSRMSVRNFKARCDTEKVRNCTQLDRDFIHKLVSCCVSELLVKENFIKKANRDAWNKGVSLTLSELSKKLAIEDLKQLKRECGGLQTLLRNHRYLFEVKQGTVLLRAPPELNEETNKYKGKPCWFLKYHPNGCLNTSEKCAYQH